MSDDAARITLLRRIEWFDTDAAGIYHWATAFRLVEAAEAALHERLGIRERTFGRTPRVHVEADFHRELRFYDAVELELAVAEVGRCSLRYDFELRPEGESEPAADGAVVVVHTDEDGEGATPWPDELGERLSEGGDQGRVRGT